MAAVFVFLGYISLLLFMLIGWGINLYAIFQFGFESLPVLQIVRLVGVPVFPLGALMGWFA